MILGLISFLLGIVGVVGTFTGTLLLIIPGAIIDVVENIVEVSSGRQNNFVTPIIFGVIGLIVYLIIGQPFWIGLLVGLCFESVIMGLFSLPETFRMLKFIFRR